MRLLFTWGPVGCFPSPRTTSFLGRHQKWKMNKWRYTTYLRFCLDLLQLCVYIYVYIYIKKTCHTPLITKMLMNCLIIVNVLQEIWTKVGNTVYNFYSAPGDCCQSDGHSERLDFSLISTDYTSLCVTLLSAESCWCCRRSFVWGKLWQWRQRRLSSSDTEIAEVPPAT